jgi:hypothetical protein
MSKFNDLKDLYEDGYRCIYHNATEDQKYTIYLKNFYNERNKSLELELDDENEFNQFKDYINNLRMS